MSLQQPSRQGTIRISTKWCVHLFVSACLCVFVLLIYYRDSYSNWDDIVGPLIAVIFIYQMVSLFKVGKKLYSFDVCFILLSYLFMFGQVLLSGLFKIDSIQALGYSRGIIDSRYDEKTMYHSALFILLCIQMIFLFFIQRKSYPCEAIEKPDYRLAKIAFPIVLLGFPCHLINSMQMVSFAQTAGSYDGLQEMTGIIDDFSNFLIYGIICLVCSRKYSQRKITVILIALVAYLVVVMMLTGDRRYQIVSIVVVFLAYIKCYNIKFTIKHIGLFLVGYLFLSLFYVLREIRTSGLVSFGEFFGVFIKMIFGGEANIFVQTLYEFGGSFYTVCLALRYIPSALGYKYGTTILSGIISIIPLGFLYQNSDIFQEGRLAGQLMELGNTTVGGSVYADLYGNFGFVFGIAAAAVLGLVLNRLFNRQKPGHISQGFYDARYFILFYALIHLVRASFTEVIRTSVWGMAILYLVYFFGMRRNYETYIRTE